MGLDKKFLAANYKRMADQELLSIFSNDIKDLTPEAQEALREELGSRGIGKGLDRVLALQNEDISEERMFEYTELIRNMACPVCLQVESKLNAAIIFNSPYEDFTIACPACLKKEIEDAKANAVGFGLLGGVRGAIKAVNQTSMYQIYLKEIEENIPSEPLKKFIQKRIGEIELCRDDKDKLARLIKHPNSTFF
jgi:hypothetical protein